MNLALAQQRSSKTTSAVPRRSSSRSAVPAICRQSYPRLMIARCACGGNCPRCKAESGSVGTMHVSQPGDPFEREAEDVADQIMRMPEPPTLYSSPGPISADGGERGILEERKLQHRSSDQSIGSTTNGQPPTSLEVPPIVDDVLRSPGQPLDSTAREFIEPRFGNDFSNVRVHTDERAAASARAVQARAYTVGGNVVFGTGQFAPRTAAGRRLLAHELTHTIQQRDHIGSQPLQKKSCISDKGAGPFTVSIIGSPGPGEIAKGHPYQFVNAALGKGVDQNTVWAIEKTGYAAGKVDTEYIETVSPGCLIWLTPSKSVASISSDFPTASIASMTVFSHGLAGFVTLRHGWSESPTNLPDYGIAFNEIKSLSSSKFTSDATIEFDSCNTGTSIEEGNLAQEAAYITGHNVKAWTGRTSYADVNSGKGGVRGSRIHTPEGTDWHEWLSQSVRGRYPVLKTFSPPGKKVWSYSSNFEITTRLPESKQFDVPSGGMVVVTCSNGAYVRPDRDAIDSDRVGIHLLESGSIFPHRGHESLQVGLPDIAIFSGMEAGKYYLEIIAESIPVNPYETLSSDIQIDVYGAT